MIENTKKKSGPKPYVPSPEVEALIRNHLKMKETMNEKQCRRSLALIAREGGPRSIAYISRQVRCCRKTILRGLEELNMKDPHPDMIRKPGAGRPRKDGLHFLLALFFIVKFATYGDPCSQRLWTSLSLRRISWMLFIRFGLTMSKNTVGKYLCVLGYSRKKNRKMEQAASCHPRRNDQFLLIQALIERFQDYGLPIVSMDCKKKEKIGNFKNDGTIYTPKGKPLIVEDHDFAREFAVPYGIYDPQLNYGFVTVGISHDTAEFAVNCLESCIEKHISKAYEGFNELLILCDGGGSNGHRSRLWKQKLKDLADRHKIEITVAHYPTGCSKYNPVEHRLFSAISKNWQGQPLKDLDTVVNLIRSTSTKAGLTVDCELDEREYPTGTKISARELGYINRTHFGPVESWNYVIHPTPIHNS